MHRLSFSSNILSPYKLTNHLDYFLLLILQKEIIQSLLRTKSGKNRKSSQLVVQGKDDSRYLKFKNRKDFEDDDNDGHLQVSDDQSSEEDGGLDNIIDQNCVDNAGEPHSDVQPNDVHSVQDVGDDVIDVNSIMSTEYGDEEPPPKLPPVSAPLATTVTKWLHVTPGREIIKNMFKDCLVPDNVKGLQLVKINEVLYQTLSLKGKKQDQKLRGINTFLARGLGPLIALLNDFVVIEGKMIKNPGLFPNNLIQIDNLTLNVPEVHRSIHCAVKLLSTCHSVLLTKRKHELKYYLHPKYHYLTKPSNPVTDQLLGDNVEQKVSDSNKMMEAARKLGRPRYRGGLHQRYDRGSYQNHFRGNTRYNPYQREFSGNNSQHQEQKFGNFS